MEKPNDESTDANMFQNLKWSFEMYNFYLRKTLIAVREYNAKVAKLKEVSEAFTPMAENLKKAVSSYTVK